MTTSYRAVLQHVTGGHRYAYHSADFQTRGEAKTAADRLGGGAQVYQFEHDENGTVKMTRVFPDDQSHG